MTFSVQADLTPFLSLLNVFLALKIFSYQVKISATNLQSLGASCCDYNLQSSWNFQILFVPFRLLAAIESAAVLTRTNKYLQVKTCFQKYVLISR